MLYNTNVLTNTTHYGSIILTKEEGGLVMYSVVKISEDKIYMLSDDGKMYKTDIANANWNVQIGDVVAVYNIENEIVLTKINKTSEVKKKTKGNGGFVKACKKVLLPLFSILFALSLIAFIVISVLPHGKKYICNIELENGDYYKAEMIFGRNEIECHIDALFTIDNSNSNFEIYNESQIRRINETQKIKYKIVGKQLYVFNNEDGAYVKVGKISSTKIIYESTYDEDIGMDAAVFFEETTMQTLKTLSLVLFIVFGVFDLLCILVVVLNKKGIIKFNKTEVNTSTLEQSNSNVSETTVKANIIEEKSDNLKDSEETSKD